MKKLQRKQLFELMQEMPMLDRHELLSIVGGDQYYLDRSGHLINTVSNPNVHEIHVDGAKKSFTIDSGTIIRSGSTDNGHGQYRDALFIDGANKGLFEYMADNTNVEWGLSYKGSGKRFDGKMYTNFDESTLDIDPHKGYDTHVHNHPHNTRCCDDADWASVYDFTYPDGRYYSKYNYRTMELYTKDNDGRHYDDLKYLERVYGSGSSH